MPPKKQLKVEGGEVVVLKKPQVPVPDVLPPAPQDYNTAAQQEAPRGRGSLLANRAAAAAQASGVDTPRYPDYSNLPDSDDEGTVVRISAPAQAPAVNTSLLARSRSQSLDISSSVAASVAPKPVATSVTTSEARKEEEKAKAARPAFAPMHLASVRKGMVNNLEPKTSSAKLSPAMMKLLKSGEPAKTDSKADSKDNAERKRKFAESDSPAVPDEAYQAAARTYLKDMPARSEKLHTGIAQKETHLTGAAELRQKMAAENGFGPPSVAGVAAAALASGMPPPPPPGFGMTATPAGNAMHCRDFKMRRCNRGASCRFLHDGQVPTGTMLSSFAGPPPAHLAVDFDPRKHANLGDWCCPGCMRAQFERNAYCRKCGFQKPDEPMLPASLRTIGVIPQANIRVNASGTPHVQL